MAFELQERFILKTAQKDCMAGSKLNLILCLILGLSACADKAEQSKPAPKAPVIESPFTIKSKSKKKASGLSEQELTELDNVDGIPFYIKEECAESICGTPSTAQTPFDIKRENTSLLPESEKLFQEVKPTLKRIFEMDIKHRIRTLQRIEEAMPRLASIQLSQDHIAIMNLMWAISFIDQVSSALREKNHKYEFDQDVLASVTPELSSEDRIIMSAMILDLYNSDEIYASTLIGSVGLEDYLKLAYPNVSREIAMTSFVSLLSNALEFLQKKFPELAIKTPDVLKSLSDKKDLTLDQTKELNQLLVWAYVHRNLTKNISFLTQRSVPVKKVVSDIQKSKVISELIQSAYTDKVNTEKLEKSIKYCRTSLNQSLLAAPTQDEAKKLSGLIEKIKPAVLAATRDVVKPSESTRAKIENRLALTTFRMPSLRQEVYAAQVASIRASADDSKRDLEILEGFTDDALFFMLYVATVQGQEDIFESLSENCERFEPGQISDSSYDTLKKIKVSWQSVRFPQYGVGIIAHELGHVVSTVLAEQSSSEQGRYLDVKSCLDQRHGVISGRYAEEDFADAISARALPLLKQSRVNADNLSCMLMEKNNRRWGIRGGLSMKFMQSETDSHSTQLFRALQIQLNSGRGIPKSCQAITASYPASILSCL